ncbi:hypothetical protein K1719_039544 [Acacia pycnantha]|nr:hypothetical protein K1719_039544 [Acacia pycnantha]
MEGNYEILQPMKKPSVSNDQTNPIVTIEDDEEVAREENCKLGEAQPTVTLQLADRSLVFPKGIIEDVLVKVDKFIFLLTLLSWCDEDRDLPLIVGRPFLATARTLIDVEKGEIKLRVDDEEVIFNMNKALKYPRDVTDCFRVDMLDEIIQETLELFSIKEPLFFVLLGTR